MFVREIRVGGAKARVLCVCVRDGSREGEWKQELCVCERERGGRGVCLIGKQMNNVGLGWRRKGDRNKCCVYRRERERERESNFTAMIHI